MRDDEVKELNFVESGRELTLYGASCFKRLKSNNCCGAHKALAGSQLNGLLLVGVRRLAQQLEHA